MIVVLNALIGFVQELRAERAMAALKRLAAVQAQVCAAAKGAVPAARTRARRRRCCSRPATSCRPTCGCSRSRTLRIDEALLTGESVPVEKTCQIAPDAELRVATAATWPSRAPTVTYGRGRGIVVATGMTTELGKIAVAARRAARSCGRRCSSG